MLCFTVISPRSSTLPRSRFALLALLYALIMVYASTFIGPAGPNFVPLDPMEALHHFLATPYRHSGSDQRADWMGNLTMLVPFGFLVAGSLWPASTRLRPWAAIAAIGVCVAEVLAVKYAQLFFPPRTVTLNYIIAQSIGASIGVVLFALTHLRLAAALRPRGGPDYLIVILQLYTAGLVLFLLMPLDFALSATDLQARLGRLPEVVTAMTGEGRPPLIRAVLILAGTLALVPVGMLLTVTRHRRAVIGRSTAAAAGRGFLLMLAVFALSTLLISGSPTLLSLAYRTLGIAIGAWLMRWLSRADLARIRRSLAAATGWLAIAYLGLLLAVNGVFSTSWISPGQAIATAYPLGLLPLFDYYIVTKAEAAKNIVGHAVMYAPIGVLAWLRGRQAAAGWLAALLAVAVEAARYLRPGLEGDINAVVVAGLAAWLTAKLMPQLWWILEGVSQKRPVLPPGTIGWRDRARAMHGGTPAGVQVTGDIEEY
jgi:VanZ family protein